WISTQYYPPRIFRAKPIWLSDSTMFLNCPFEIQELLEEIYVCLQSNCHRAAAMATRAVLEQMFVLACGDHGSFKGNLNAFQNAGHISPTQRDFLDIVLDARHATIRRG